MKKTLSLILAALLLASSFISCSEKQNDGGETGSAAGTADTAASADETAPEEVKTDSNVRLWEGKTFNGYGVNILGRQSTTYSIDFEAEELTGEIVNDAVYNRNIKVEDELDIALEYIPSNASELGFNQDVVNSVRAADGAYDLVSSYAYFGVSMAQENVLDNLHAVPNLTLTNSWFNQSFVNEMTLFDQLYFVVGDLTLTATDRMMITFFNKELAGNYYTGTDFYNLVYEGGWTIDYFNQLIGETWTDENGNGRRDGFDTYGFAVNTGSVPTDGLMSALRVRVAIKNEEGVPEITVYNDHTNNAFEKLRKLYYNTTGTGLNMDMGGKFVNETAIFLMACANFAISLRDFEPDYGVLPLPKYDEAQDGYYTTSQDAYNIVSIPTTCQNFEAVGATLDYLSCLSQESVYPAYFENNFQKQYMRSEQDSVMFDYIREGLEFNIGVVYSNCVGNPQWIYRDTLTQNGSLTSSYRGMAKVYTRSLEKFLSLMQEFKDQNS